jgi:uncharacterized Zn finger protein
MREDFRSKAERYLVAGRLEVRRVDARRIEATCRGDSGEHYELGYERDDWYCACPARGRCCHMQALMLVTIRPEGSAP